MKYRNPILPGFYPDPSVCRVGEDYYLVNSSFEFFPGVPLWHSRDLVNWEQLGHVLTRKSQLPLAGSGTSGGIFAPTIRYHDGRFYMITTNVTGLGNFIVWTDDIRGEWSDPAPIQHEGIDPSLFWDEDGKCYYQGTHFCPGGQCIGQFEIDPMTGEKLSETREIWYGTGGKCPEGPHMYKIGGKYYLMIAEGGTEWGHMETIARSDSVWGPFESCPHNPIATNRNFSPDFKRRGDPSYQELGCIGHADLVDDPEGNWWLVFHGVRPSQNQLHHIGRETMLAPVTWDEDGWPVVNGGAFITPEMEAPGRGGDAGFVPQNSFTFTEDFTKETTLPCRWAFLRDLVFENYGNQNGLTLTASADTLDGQGSPTFAGVRQSHLDAEIETVLDLAPQEGVEAGLTVFHTNEHHYDLIVKCREGKRVAFLRRRVCDMVTESPVVPLPDSGPVSLRIKAGRLLYEFFAGPEGGALSKVGEGRSQLLSTEAMAGTFTGCFFGMFCQGNPGAKARFTRFTYGV